MISQVAPNTIPLSLLLEADPCHKRIKEYLDNAICYAYKERDLLIGACIISRLNRHEVEVMNIAVLPEKQQLGIGSKLLTYSLEQLKQQNIKHVFLGTGTFGHQLSFYQRLGFRVDEVIKNHFISHYDEPLFENGIQHKDMLRLSLTL